jgi:long-chain acyl-CoA synthetase
VDFPSGRLQTYSQVDLVTDEICSCLVDLGLTRGERVALLHPNHSDFILAYISIIKAGAAAVPINTLYTPHEIAYILQDSKARLLITTRDFEHRLKGLPQELSQMPQTILKERDETLLDALRRGVSQRTQHRPPQTSPEDLAFIFYTSGTTGLPKGVMLTHRNIVFGGANTALHYGLRETDVTIACLPLVHIFANASPVLGSLNSGGCVVVMERFQTDAVLEAIERHRVTWFPGVPTMFSYLIQGIEGSNRDLSSLRMGLSGGASLSEEHLRAFERLFGAEILEVYGLTESTGLVTANPLYGVRKVGSIGVSVAGVGVRVVDDEGKDVPRGDVGEIVFSGPNATPGYWNLPDVTKRTIRNGWVHTGDLAYQDEEGYFFMAGRRDELIISGGYNIYPREIEEVLYRHPSVGEAAVVGAHHPELGEVPKAFVAPREGCNISAEQIIDFCREHLAPYKVPKEVVIMRELPKNPTGKILKKELKVLKDADG